MADSDEDNPFIVIRGDYCYELPEPDVEEEEDISDDEPNKPRRRNKCSVCRSLLHNKKNCPHASEAARLASSMPMSVHSPFSSVLGGGMGGLGGVSTSSDLLAQMSKGAGYTHIDQLNVAAVPASLPAHVSASVPAAIPSHANLVGMPVHNSVHATILQQHAQQALAQSQAHMHAAAQHAAQLHHPSLGMHVPAPAPASAPVAQAPAPAAAAPAAAPAPAPAPAQAAAAPASDVATPALAGSTHAAPVTGDEPSAKRHKEVHDV